MRGQLASAVRLLGSFSLANMPIKQPGAEKNANMFKGQPPPKKLKKHCSLTTPVRTAGVPFTAFAFKYGTKT